VDDIVSVGVQASALRQTRRKPSQTKPHQRRIFLLAALQIAFSLMLVS
jgi:hypothetical protein